MTKSKLIEEISLYDLSFVKEKLILDYQDSETQSDQLIVELKRWLTLCLMHPERNYTMRGPVDKAWHTFILFTYEYKKFCEAFGEFVHHRPNLQAVNESSNDQIEGYTLFLKDYREFFGQENSSLWPPSDLRVKSHTDPGGGGGNGGNSGGGTGPTCDRTCGAQGGSGN